MNKDIPTPTQVERPRIEIQLRSDGPGPEYIALGLIIAAAFWLLLR